MSVLRKWAGVLFFGTLAASCALSQGVPITEKEFHAIISAVGPAVKDVRYRHVSKHEESDRADGPWKLMSLAITEAVPPDRMHVTYVRFAYPERILIGKESYTKQADGRWKFDALESPVQTPRVLFFTMGSGSRTKFYKDGNTTITTIERRGDTDPSDPKNTILHSLTVDALGRLVEQAVTLFRDGAWNRNTSSYEYDPKLTIEAPTVQRR